MACDRREPRRVLVTGVGGAPGFDLARSLMRYGCDVIGVDANPLAPGLLLPGITARTTVSADDPGYGAEMLGLCRELEPDALMSTVEAELPQLVAMQSILDDLGVRTCLPDMRAVRACLDKAAFHAVLAQHRIPTPRTFLPDEIDAVPDGCPLVVKPRRGQGAQDVHFCVTRQQAKILCELVPHAIIQERIDGREFTADCLVDRAGRASVILRYRLLVKGGLSVVGATFHDEEAAERVTATLAAVGAVGACCAQGFICDRGADRIVMTEVNARVGGGFPLSEAAGADLVGQTLNGLFGLPVDHDRLTYTPGIYLTKYTETLAAGPRPATAPPFPAQRRATTMTHSTVPDVSRNQSPYLYGPEGEAVSRVLRSGQYGHTEVTEQFERSVAEFLGVPDAVAVASGTAALHIALLTAGIGPGHEVIVPSMTFCATVQAILACGAHPRFIEVNPDTLCVQSRDVLDAITPFTRAMMPVLYGGRAVDLSDIQDVLADRDITVIEDAAHAFGSHNGTMRVGATGRLTCFSFGPIKNLTCGQGGMIIPRGPEDARTGRGLRLLGVVESAAQRSASISYTVDGFGFRAQMSSLNAAIGLVQLEHFATADAKRKQLWQAYAAALQGLDDVALMDVDVDSSVPSLCVVRIPARDKVFRFLRSRNVGVGVHYPPNHLQPAFARWHRSLPVTEAVAGQILTLPFHLHMSTDDVEHVVLMLGRALATVRASR